MFPFLIVQPYIGKGFADVEVDCCTVSSERPPCSLHSLFLETIDIL